MSLSLILIAKGALVLWKAHGAHLALMKGGAYLYSTYGLGTTVAAAKTVAVCAGCYAVANSTVCNSAEGFKLLKDGILENSPSKALNGFWKLRKAYTSMTDLTKDFSSFLNESNIDSDLADYLIDGANEIASYLKDKKEEQAVELIALFEDIFKEKNSPMTNYDRHIAYLYSMSFGESSLSYNELLGCAGECYDSIRKYNASLEKGPSYCQFDHFLVFCIAGWMKDHISNTIIKSKSQKAIAEDITGNIFKYLG